MVTQPSCPRLQLHSSLVTVMSLMAERLFLKTACLSSSRHHLCNSFTKQFCSSSIIISEIESEQGEAQWQTAKSPENET